MNVEIKLNCSNLRYSPQGEVKLPNTWDSLPKFRYPYYDPQGRGYLLYGYGGPELYNYSQFERLEGYF